MNRLAFCLIALTCSLANVAATKAQDWTITTADLRSQSANLTAINQDAVTTSSAGAASTTLPLDQFLSATCDSGATTSADSFDLMFRDGQRLSGRPRAVLGENLAWTNSLLGEIDIPLQQLRGIDRTATNHATPTAEPAPKQDIVNLRNGDRVSGVFTACTSSTVTIQADAGPVEVPLATISRITFAAAGAAQAPKPTTLPEHQFLIGLADGSQLNGSAVALANEQLTFTFAGAVHQTPLASIDRIEQLNGPVSWLSSRRPIEEISQPYFGPPAAAWPARFDTAVEGGPLIAGGKHFDRGIGVHAYSRLTFAIEPGWATFRTQYAIDRGPEQENRLADLTVRVSLNGSPVYQRQHVRSGALSDVITIPLHGAAKLTLECDYGPGGDVQDRLNWIQPALTRQSTTTTQP